MNCVVSSPRKTLEHFLIIHFLKLIIVDFSYWKLRGSIIPQRDKEQSLYELCCFLYKKSTWTFSNRIHFSKLNIVDFSYWKLRGSTIRQQDAEQFSFSRNPLENFLIVFIFKTKHCWLLLLKITRFNNTSARRRTVFIWTA